jgi:hypothetical protein
LVQVNQDRGIVDRQGLPRVYRFLLSLTMHSDDRLINAEKPSNGESKKKLSKVLSTKVTREDSKKFRVLTTIGYQNRVIKEDRPSEMLRFIITLALGHLQNQPGFSMLQDKGAN